VFRERLPVLAEISPASALAMTLLGFSTRLNRWAGFRRSAYRVVRLCSLLTLGIGFLGIATAVLAAESPTGLNLALGLCYSLVAGSQLMITRSRLAFLRRGALAAALFLTGSALVIHLYGLYQHVAPNLRIDVVTAAVLAFCILGLLHIHLRSEMLGMISCAAQPAVSPWCILLGAILIPVILGWFSLMAERMSLVSAGVGTLLHALASTLVFAAVVGWALRISVSRNAARLDTDNVLAENERIYRELFSGRPEPCFVLSMDGKIRWANEAAREIAGSRALPSVAFADLLASGSDPLDVAGMALAMRRVETREFAFRGRGGGITRLVFDIVCRSHHGSPADLVLLARPAESNHLARRDSPAWSTGSIPVDLRHSN
jgi:PAS domain-containing protein